MKSGLVALAGLALVGGASGCGGHAAASPSTSTLTGLFRITAGACPNPRSTPTGSYLVVISAATGKEVANKAGGCANPAYTLLRPGTDGGLRTGRFQPEPTPLFDARRNSRAAAIIAPTDFDGYRLGFSTSQYDEQDAPGGDPAFVAPIAVLRGRQLDLDLRSLTISYAGPPGSTCKKSFGVGCWELGSRSATGSYDAATRRYTVNWFNGESFNPKGDSIEVHLTGSFVPSKS